MIRLKYKVKVTNLRHTSDVFSFVDGKALSLLLKYDFSTIGEDRTLDSTLTRLPKL